MGWVTFLGAFKTNEEYNVDQNNREISLWDLNVPQNRPTPCCVIPNTCKANNIASYGGFPAFSHLNKQPYLKIKENKWNKSKRRLEEIKLKKWKHLEEYCENSTIHGLTYFPDKNIHFLERIWWIISVCCSVVACSMLISKSYEKWNENPIIVTFSEKMTSLNEIPFPAVTICPESKTNRKLFNYSTISRRLKPEVGPPYFGVSERKFKTVAALYQICSMEKERISIGDNFTTDDIFDSMKSVAPNKADTLFICKFRSYSDDCEYLFQELMTDDGLCFTFNSLNSDAMFMDGFNEKMLVTDRNQTDILNHWSLEDGYDTNFDEANNKYLYPYRVLSAGADAGLKIDLTMQENDVDAICQGPLTGFKIILHSPNELPEVTGQHFPIPIGQDIRVAIKPDMLTTMKSLRDYSSDRRQCYFNADRQLRYMKTYTQRNCELECLTNYTLSICGCVKFSMPRDNNIPICGTEKIRCCGSAARTLLENVEKIKKCNCLPACTSISYDAEITQAPYEWANQFGKQHVKSDGLKFASLQIFFKENQFIASKRSELVGLTDFIASCGGLLGLFMGVSLLSIIELIYYFSLRLLCTVRSKNIKEKSNLVSMQPIERNRKNLILSDPIW